MFHQTIWKNSSRNLKILYETLLFVIFATGTAIKVLLRQVPGCRNLPENKIVNGRMLPSRALAVEDYSGRGLRWVAFAFESVRLWIGPLALIDVEIVVVAYLFRLTATLKLH